MFMSPKNQVFGLDIGFETLKLCQARRHGQAATIIGMADIPITERILEKDQIKNKAATANIIKEACRKAKPHPITAQKIVSSLPETFVFSKTIHIPKMNKNELATAVPNEAAGYLPIPASDVYIDYQILITHPDEPLMDVLIAAAPKRLVDDYVEMAGMAGMELSALETKSISTGRALIPTNSQTGIAILHIGTEISRISVWDKGEIRLVTTVATGKNQIMESAKATDPTLNNVAQIDLAAENADALSVAFDPIINELTEAIRYHQNRGYKPSPVTQIKICGSAALIKNIAPFIEQKIKIKSVVATPQYKTNLGVEPEFMTAFGLALREV